MTSTIITANDTDGFSLAAVGDSVIVPQNIIVSNSLGNGIFANSGVNVQVQGGVYGTAYAISVGTPGQTSILHVGQGGIVATASNFYSALFINGSHRIENYGQITGNGFGGYGVYLSGGGTTVNHGLISGTEYGFYADSAPSDVVRLTNFGTISGSNTSFTAGSSQQFVTNFGTMLGEVRLGSGTSASVFDSTSGRVVGNIYGTLGNDTITAGTTGNTVYGGSGNDTINGNIGNDTLNGDGGNDTIDGGTGVDTINGGTGTDTVSYRSSTTGVQVYLAADVAWDGTHMDFISSVENVTGSNAADFLYGNSGDNIIEGLGGVDTIDGGAGSDTVSYLTSSSAVAIDLTSGTVWDGVSTDFLTSIENAIGSNLNDNLFGSAADNIFEGLGGNDTINGQGGSDTASYRSSTTAVQVDLQSQNSFDGTSVDFFVSIENAIGSAQGDQFFGSAGDNIFEGLGGVDFINGGSGGSDTASYRSSATAVQVDLASQNSFDGTSVDFFTSIENAIGSAQGDNFFGSTGVNVFEGLAGNDIMTGNGGNDFFRFAASGTNADTITDFDADPTGGQDLIDVSGRGFSAGSIGTAIVISGNAANTLITIGTDTITLSGVNVANVTAADFIF